LALIWAAKEIEQDFFVNWNPVDLACYCPLDQPCHADVLLELANK